MPAETDHERAERYLREAGGDVPAAIRSLRHQAGGALDRARNALMRHGDPSVSIHSDGTPTTPAPAAIHADGTPGSVPSRRILPDGTAGSVPSTTDGTPAVPSLSRTADGTYRDASGARRRFRLAGEDERAERDREVRRLHGEGLSLRAIAERLGVGRGTVARALRGEDESHG